MTLQDDPSRAAFLLNLTPEQRAGLFVWPSLSGPVLDPQERYLLELYKPSGVVLFRRNMISLKQAESLCADIHNLTRAPHQPKGAVIAIDEEGGRVYRLPSPFPRNEPASSFSAPENEEAHRSQVFLQAAVARAIGVDCILAPVADILTRADNPAIGDRAFSSQADVVARCARVVVQELHHAGLLSCAKHFPGHGHTATDSHKGFATTDVDLNTLRAREWLPFETLFSQEKMKLVMTAHVVCTSLDPQRPATLSPLILQDYLRKELNFDGLILSDDLRMNAISDFYGVSKKVTAAIEDNGQNSDDVSDDSFLKRASCDALEAGCDILLSCQSVLREKVVLESVMQHVESRLHDDVWHKKAQRVARVLGRHPE